MNGLKEKGAGGIEKKTRYKYRIFISSFRSHIAIYQMYLFSPVPGVAPKSISSPVRIQKGNFSLFKNTALLSLLRCHSTCSTYWVEESKSA
jgi:hypothetical protein